jgi:hypothetical protein
MTNQTGAMINQTTAMMSQVDTMVLSLEETRKIVGQNEQTVEAMQGQLDAMKEQVKLASKQTDLSSRQIDLLVLSECAYLSVQDFEIPPIRNDQLAVNGKIFNRGNTPAFNLQRQIQIAIGKGTPPPGWGRFDWDSLPYEIESVQLLRDESINFTTPEVKIGPDLLKEINEGRQTIVIDGQCRYRDNVGDLLIYVFGVAVQINPPRTHIRYQEHRREKRNPN